MSSNNKKLIYIPKAPLLIPFIKNSKNPKNISEHDLTKLISRIISKNITKLCIEGIDSLKNFKENIIQNIKSATINYTILKIIGHVAGAEAVAIYTIPSGAKHYFQCVGNEYKLLKQDNILNPKNISLARIKCVSGGIIPNKMGPIKQGIMQGMVEKIIDKLYTLNDNHQESFELLKVIPQLNALTMINSTDVAKYIEIPMYNFMNDIDEYADGIYNYLEERDRDLSQIQMGEPFFDKLYDKYNIHHYFENPHVYTIPEVHEQSEEITDLIVSGEQCVPEVREQSEEFTDLVVIDEQDSQEIWDFIDTEQQQTSMLVEKIKYTSQKTEQESEQELEQALEYINFALSTAQLIKNFQNMSVKQRNKMVALKAYQIISQQIQLPQVLIITDKIFSVENAATTFVMYALPELPIANIVNIIRNLSNDNEVAALGNIISLFQQLHIIENPTIGAIGLGLVSWSILDNLLTKMFTNNIYNFSVVGKDHFSIFSWGHTVTYSNKLLGISVSATRHHSKDARAAAEKAFIEKLKEVTYIRLGINARHFDPNDIPTGIRDIWKKYMNYVNGIKNYINVLSESETLHDSHNKPTRAHTTPV